MEIIKSHPFTHRGLNYEVRVWAAPGGYEVRAFRDGEFADGYSFSVSTITNMDYKQTHGVAAYDQLIEMAQSAVESDAWSRYLDAVRAAGS